MALMTARYTGKLKVECRHEASGNTMVTEAPAPAGETDKTFSPTDICAASLAACAMTLMGLMAERHHIDLSGLWLEINKSMGKDPSRIARIELIFHMPQGEYSDKEKAMLKRAVDICPVHKSFDPAMEQVFDFRWP